jgi:hypothetical protein
MNERIKELAEQAGLDMTYPHCIEGDIDDLERFAELVRQALEQWDTSDMAHRSGGLTVDVTDLIQRAIDMERKECAKTYRKIMDDAIKRAILREREVCAKLCIENAHLSTGYHHAAAIRERTE